MARNLLAERQLIKDLAPASRLDESSQQTKLSHFFQSPMPLDGHLTDHCSVGRTDSYKEFHMNEDSFLTPLSPKTSVIIMMTTMLAFGFWGGEDLARVVGYGYLPPVQQEQKSASLNGAMSGSYMDGDHVAIDGDYLVGFLAHNDPAIDQRVSLTASVPHWGPFVEKGHLIPATDHAPDVPVHVTGVLEEISKPYHFMIVDAANRHRVDPALVKAIIMAESAYDPRAISGEGAAGLMQLMPRTAEALGVEDAFNAEKNVDGGVRYLKQLLNEFNYDIELTLAAYNAGIGTVRRHQGIPPSMETQSYIKKVFFYYQYYKDQADRQTDDA